MVEYVNANFCKEIRDKCNAKLEEFTNRVNKLEDKIFGIYKMQFTILGALVVNLIVLLVIVALNLKQ